MSFYTLLTAIGAAAHANAQATNTAVHYTHLAIGDGNGADVVPSEGMQALVHEVYRLPISTVTQDPDNPSWYVIEAQVPANIGGWTMREVAACAGSNPAIDKPLLVGNFPTTYKPILSEGSGRDMTVRVVVEIGNADTVQLTIDPSVAVATNQTVTNAVGMHAASRNHPDATTALKGFLRLATVAEAVTGTSEAIAVTPAGLSTVAGAVLNAAAALLAATAAENYFTGQN